MAEITVDWSALANKIAFTGVDVLAGLAKANLPTTGNASAPVVVVPPAPVPSPTPPAPVSTPPAPTPSPDKVRDEGKLSVDRSTLLWGGIGAAAFLLGVAYLMAKGG